jgi:hypothetical protein
MNLYRSFPGQCRFFSKLAGTMLCPELSMLRERRGADGTLHKILLAQPMLLGKCI